MLFLFVLLSVRFLLFNILYSVFNEHNHFFALSSKWIVKSEEWIGKNSLREFLVGSSGLEPPTSRLSGARSNQLSYEPVAFCLSTQVFVRSYSPHSLVEMKGFEPLTPCLQGRCSPSWATPPYRFPDGFLSFEWSFWSVIQNWTTRNVPLQYALTISPISYLCIHERCIFLLYANTVRNELRSFLTTFSIERRWSSRTFRYGYLVTT